MTNKELFYYFSVVRQSDTVFDAYVELKGFKKEYKKSDFYKQTKMPLFKAYKLYLDTFTTQLFNKIADFLDIDKLSIKFSEFLDGVDENSLERFIQTILSKFNLDNLDTEKGDLKNILDQIKSLT